MIDKIKKVFTFWKQKEKPKVHWWSVIEGVEKVTPILPAKEVIPDWWKKVERMIEGRLDDKGTVRNCPSFPEYITQGFVVPLWCDLHIEIEHDKSWKWRSPDGTFKFSSHNNEQFRNSKGSAFSYFIAGDNRECQEDNGFALSNWTEILFDNSNIIINEDIAIAMGNYTFKNEASKIKVEYSFVYKNYGDEIKIILHHSSLPYKI